MQVQCSSDVPSMITSKTSTDDSSYTEDGEIYCPSPKRFKATSPTSHFKWDLSEDLKTYAMVQFHTYIPDADLDDGILTKSPAPRNLKAGSTLDNNLKGFLDENQNFGNSYQEISMVSW